MARPVKCRRVCCIPDNRVFLPACENESGESVTLTVDEYETIRLIDRVGLSQEECADFMQVSRTTAQQIYTCARRKLADALVEGLPLQIKGGNYQLCGDAESPHPGHCKNCPRNTHSKEE